MGLQDTYGGRMSLSLHVAINRCGVIAIVSNSEV